LGHFFSKCFAKVSFAVSIPGFEYVAQGGQVNMGKFWFGLKISRTKSSWAVFFGSVPQAILKMFFYLSHVEKIAFSLYNIP